MRNIINYKSSIKKTVVSLVVIINTSIKATCFSIKICKRNENKELNLKKQRTKKNFHTAILEFNSYLISQKTRDKLGFSLAKLPISQFNRNLFRDSGSSAIFVYCWIVSNPVNKMAITIATKANSIGCNIIVANRIQFDTEFLN